MRRMMNLPRAWRVLAAIVVAVAASTALLAPSPASAASDSTPPTAPTNLRATTVSFTWVSLAWAGSTDNSGALYYQATINGPTGQYSQTSLDPAQSFGGLQAGQAYTVTVRALDYAGNASAAVSVQFTTLARTGPPPTAPANLRGEFLNGVLHAIVWDPSTFNGGVSYQVYIGSDSVWATSFTRVTVFELVHIACAVDLGGTYTLKVQAIGTDNYLSDFSAPLTVTIPLTAPVR